MKHLTSGEQHAQFEKKKEALHYSLNLNNRVHLMGINNEKKPPVLNSKKLLADAEKIYKWLNK